MLKQSEKDSLVRSTNDLNYFESRKEYFSSWSEKIWQFYNGRTKEEYDRKAIKGLELPPYKLEELDEFERVNRISLPIQLKYYLTHISRWICKYHGAVFQIYDTDDMDDIFNVEKAWKAVDTHGSILKLDFLSGPAFCVKETIKFENCSFIWCDICDDLIPDRVHCCDLCTQDFCTTCIKQHEEAHLAHVVQSYERQPFCRGKLCTTPRNIPKPSSGSIVRFEAAKCQTCIQDCSEFFHCWDCETYCCSDCISHAPHDSKCFSKTFFKYHNSRLPAKERDEYGSDIKDVKSKYGWRFGEGMLAIGEYGCGETDFILLNGPNKGDMFFWFSRESSLYRMTSSFFNYLCYSNAMND